MKIYLEIQLSRVSVELLNQFDSMFHGQSCDSASRSGRHSWNKMIPLGVAYNEGSPLEFTLAKNCSPRRAGLTRLVKMYSSGS